MPQPPTCASGRLRLGRDKPPVVAASTLCTESLMARASRRRGCLHIAHDFQGTGVKPGAGERRCKTTGVVDFQPRPTEVASRGV